MSDQKDLTKIKKVCKSLKRDSSSKEVHAIEKSKKNKSAKKGTMNVTVPKEGSVQVDKKKSNRKKKTTIDPRSKTHDGPRFTNGVSCHFFRGGTCRRGKKCHFIHEDPGKSGEPSAYESDYSKNYKNKFPTIGEDQPKDSKAVQGSRQKGTRSI